MALQSEKSYPQEREIAPDFVLSSASGTEYQLSKLRGRRNLVLVFVGKDVGATTALAKALAEHEEEIRDEETIVLIIVHGDIPTARAFATDNAIPFPVLVDADGSAHSRYGGPAVYLTDRYGEIYAFYRATLPAADEILASLRHINAACPE